jgi:hypothetical protein
MSLRTTTATAPDCSAFSALRGTAALRDAAAIDECDLVERRWRTKRAAEVVSVASLTRT